MPISESACSSGRCITFCCVICGRSLRPCKPPQIVYYGLQQLGEQCSVLLSALARASQQDDDAAFEAGAQQIPEAKLQLLPPEACGLNALDQGIKGPGPGHAEAAGPVGRRLCIVHLCRCGGQRDRVRAAASDLRHARLPDAAARRGAGGFAVALRSAASERRVVKPQPSHDSFAPSASLAALQQRATLLRKSAQILRRPRILRSRNAAACRRNHSGTSHRTDPRGERRISAIVARTAHEAAGRVWRHGHLSSDAIVPARRARPAAQPGIHDRRMVSSRR